MGSGIIGGGINVSLGSVNRQSADASKVDEASKVKTGIRYYYNVLDIAGVVIRERAPFDEENRSKLKKGNVFNLIFEGKEQDFVITNTFPLCDGVGTVVVDRI